MLGGTLLVDGISSIVDNVAEVNGGENTSRLRKRGQTTALYLFLVESVAQITMRRFNNPDMTRK